MGHAHALQRFGEALVMFVHTEDVYGAVLHRKGFHAFKHSLPVMQAQRQRAHRQVMKGCYLCVLPLAVFVLGNEHMLRRYFAKGQ